MLWYYPGVLLTNTTFLPQRQVHTYTLPFLLASSPLLTPFLPIPIVETSLASPMTFEGKVFPLTLLTFYLLEPSLLFVPFVHVKGPLLEKPNPLQGDKGLYMSRLGVSSG